MSINLNNKNSMKVQAFDLGNQSLNSNQKVNSPLKKVERETSLKRYEPNMGAIEEESKF